MIWILVAVAGIPLSVSAATAQSGASTKPAPQPSAKALEHRGEPRSNVPQHAAHRNRAKAAAAQPNRPASPQ
jgi:hypothetical protein